MLPLPRVPLRRRPLHHRLRAQIVPGPTPLGVYTADVPADGDPFKDILARLRSEPQVAFAEPGGEGDGR